MYERFTDRAHKVLRLANQEAQRQSHEFIGPEHILIGIMREGTGVAVNLVDDFGTDPETVTCAVREAMTKGESAPRMGKLPQTESTKRVIQLAIKKSQEIGHKYVGTEHLLLGLLALETDCQPAAPKSVIFTVFKKFGITEKKAREAILALLGTPNSRPLESDDPLEVLTRSFILAATANPGIATDPVAMLGWFTKAEAANMRCLTATVDLDETSLGSVHDELAALRARLSVLEERSMPSPAIVEKR
jgi:ATP-dependent Clp protease ATP-binding subunit ClpA